MSILVISKRETYLVQLIPGLGGNNASFLFGINAIILGDDCRFDIMLFRCCLRIIIGKGYLKLCRQVTS